MIENLLYTIMLHESGSPLLNSARDFVIERPIEAGVLGFIVLGALGLTYLYDKFYQKSTLEQLYKF